MNHVETLNIPDEKLDLINHIPTGIGIYIVKNDIPIVVFLNDGYFQMIGMNREDYLKFHGRDTLAAVHPEDQHLIMEATHKAITNNSKLSVTVRVMLKNKNDYHYIQVDGSLINHYDDTYVFYASFTNVDSLENTKAALEKSQTSLEMALSLSKVISFEYDPVLHTAEGYTQENAFLLPNHVDNYPDCLIDCGYFHPDDVESVRDAIERVDRGEHEVNVEVRILEGPHYVWYSCKFTSYYDHWKGYSVAICSMLNISHQKKALQDYHNHLDTIMRLNPNAVSTFRMNLTQNICGVGYSIYKNILNLRSSKTVDCFFINAEQFIKNEKERLLFRQTFQRSAILDAFEHGTTRISLEHQYLLEDKQTEWISTSLYLMRNPNNNDVEAILYTNSINRQKIEQLVLKEALQRDYKSVAVINLDSEEYFLFDSEKNVYGEHRANFSKNSDLMLKDIVPPEEYETISRRTSLARITERLASSERYSLILPVITEDDTVSKKYQMNYYYINREEHLILASIRNITNTVLLEQLQYASEHDSLTDLYNRKKTFAECKKMIDAHPNDTLAICHFDIQRFRLLNSFFGEEEGDRLLKYIADLLRITANDYPYYVYGRIESDIFCIIFPYDEAIFQKHRQLVHDSLLNFKPDFFLEPACGIYLIQDTTLSPESMFNRATIAAKNCKKRVLSSFIFYDDSMESALVQEQEVINDMLAAIQQEQFMVYLQPKYSLNTGLPYGAEALVRWQHPQKGLIMPGKFIPIFEKNGFITQLDHYMWEHVCQLLRKWIDSGLTPAPISVNISRVSMYNTNTVSFLNQLVQKYKIPPQLLNLELTESAYMDDPEDMKLRLRKLRESGFLIMMDDFGSGYSSLNTLKELPVDFLKVDMRFLSSSEDSNRSRIILASVIRMASWLELPVIVEGVETIDQQDFLRGIGCQFAQGFLFARPMPVRDYEDKILEKNDVPTMKMSDNLSFITQIITNTNTVAHYLANQVPIPLAFVDLQEHDFSFLRANNVFIDTFGFGNDLAGSKQLQQYHMSKPDYDHFLYALQKAAASFSPIECTFFWHTDDIDKRRYSAKIKYLGHSAYSTILIVSFTDITAFSRKESLSSDEQQHFMDLESRDIYTMPQLQEKLRFLNGLFDLARIVFPEDTTVLSLDADWKPVMTNTNCFSYWKNHSRCKNCISLRAIREHRNISKIEEIDNKSFTVIAHPITLYNPDGSQRPACLEFVTQLSDVSHTALDNAAISNRLQELQRLVYRDSLTTVYNRRYFDELLYLKPEDLNKEVLRVAFVMLDLVDFKDINDEYGHSFGDQVLLQTASELQRNIQTTDSVIRYGGDEFLIVLVGYAPKHLRECVCHLKESVENIRYGRENNFSVRSSIGYSYTEHFNAHPVEIAKMIREADKQMYQDQ